MEFICYHRDRPGSVALRHDLVEQHWSYMDRYAKTMIARGPTLDGDVPTGSVHIVDLPDPSAARAFAFDEPNYQAGVYRDVLLRRWRNTLGRTMWDFPGGRTGGNRYLVLGLGLGTGQATDLAVPPRPGRVDRVRAAALRRRHHLAGHGGAGPGARPGHGTRAPDPGRVRRHRGAHLAVRRAAVMTEGDPGFVERAPQPPDGDERSLLVGWLAFHRSALEAKCAGLDAAQLVARSAPPSPLSLLGLVRHVTEMERVYAVWALGPKADLEWVWGDYTDGGPEWDIDVDATMVDESMAAWERERLSADERIGRHASLDSIGAGNGHSVRWNLQKLVGEYARHNGHADLIRERIDGQTGE